MEVWKPVKDYEDCYEVSNFGRIRSLDRWVTYSNGRRRLYKSQILKCSPNNRGYHKVDLNKNSKTKTENVHRIVYQTFKGEIGGGLVIDHIDNNKSNNCVDNLQAVTIRENTTKDRWRYKSSSKYTGVSWHKRQKKWNAVIMVDGKGVHIGCYNCETRAYIEYLKKRKEIGT